MLNFLLVNLTRDLSSLYSSKIQHFLIYMTMAAIISVFYEKLSIVRLSPAIVFQWFVVCFILWKFPMIILLIALLFQIVNIIAMIILDDWRGLKKIRETKSHW